MAITQTQKLNDFAIRCFRDMADQDYIAARSAFFNQLYPQFFSAGQQAFEKYIKAMLLFHRIPAAHIRHDAAKGLRLIEKHLGLQIAFSSYARESFDQITDLGQDRYLTYPWVVQGREVLYFDTAIWELRRYCRLSRLNAADVASFQPVERVSDQRHLDTMLKSERIPGGILEKIMKDRNHPARRPLLYKNIRFMTRLRTTLPWRDRMHSVNSPLSLFPEMLDEVGKYVYLTKPAQQIFREAAARKAKGPRR